MNKQEIIEGNKLIMEFMGWRTTEVDDYGSSVSSTAEKTLVHRDWNLLMSVVEKISNPEMGLVYTIREKHFGIFDSGRRGNLNLNAMRNIVSTTDESTILAVWKGVVYYITDHNQQNNS